MKKLTYLLFFFSLAVMSCEKNPSTPTPNNPNPNDTIPTDTGTAPVHVFGELFVGFYNNGLESYLAKVSTDSLDSIHIEKLVNVTWGTLCNAVTYDPATSTLFKISDGALFYRFNLNNNTIINNVDADRFYAPVFTGNKYYAIHYMDDRHKLVTFSPVTGQVLEELVDSVDSYYSLTSAGINGSGLFFLAKEKLLNYDISTGTTKHYTLPGTGDFFGFEPIGNGQFLTVNRKLINGVTKTLLQRVSVSGTSVIMTQIADLNINGVFESSGQSTTYDKATGTFYYTNNTYANMKSKTYLAYIHVPSKTVLTDSVDGEIEGIKSLK